MLQGQVHISEVYFDTYFNEGSQDEYHHHGEFIELYNRSSQSVDLSNWMLLDYSGRGSFTIPQGTTILANDFIVIAYGTTSGNYSNDFPILFPSALGKESKIVYQQSIMLKNGREGVTLLDNQGNYKDEIRYTLDYTCRETIGNSFCFNSTISNGGSPKRGINVLTSSIDRFFSFSLQRESFDDEKKIVEKEATPFSLVFNDNYSGNGNSSNTNYSSDENYVYSRKYLEPTNFTDASKKQVQEIKYFDGLGRPKQNISIKATPLGKDLVTPIEYNDYGKQVKEFLPLPQSSSGNGAINTSPETTYYTNNFPGAILYSEKKLELSPLDRLQEQGHPGTEWNVGSSHSQKFYYGLNLDGEVKKFVSNFNYNTFQSKLLIDSSEYVDSNGYYLANQLYKNKVTDEDGNESYEFKNGQGQTILIRKYDGNIKIDTYYVYNNFNRLAFIIPPLASKKYDELKPAVEILSTDSVLNQLCYQYKYDLKNRIVEKKLPGKDWEYMVYDMQDRLVANQDANMRKNNQWLFTKYDQFSRIAYTGLTIGNNRVTEQSNADRTGANYIERKSSISFTQNGLDVYYGNPTGLISYPSSISTLLLVNYYDTYPIGTPTVTYKLISEKDLLTDSSTASVSTKGLVTANLIKNVEDDNWTKSYTWYDQKARTVASYSQNHLGGYTRTETELDFSGTTQKTYTFHKRLATDTEILVKERFEYDHHNRLLKHFHQVNNNTEELLTFNEYNELGQVINKKVGGTATAVKPLQKIDYNYNIRGWMTNINDLTNLGADLFGYDVNYNVLDSRFSGTAKYNGNIAQITWKTNYDRSDRKLRNYSYSYDSLNRLLYANYDGYDEKTTSSSSEKDFYNESLTYDVNGNILTLKRFSNPANGTTPQKIDDLVYNYENSNYSNRLSKITLPNNEQNNLLGYDALQNIFSYDDSGNIIKHLDRKISDIFYNYLNLPYRIVQTSGTISYFFRADGLKVRKISGTQVTDYLDGFQYETVGTTTTLQFLPTKEGYYDFANARYTYNYTDHLGNVRLSYADSNKDGLIDPSTEIIEEINYYPFGLKQTGYNNLAGNPSYKIGYNGKELQSEIQMYDFGARMYMPDLGRWGVVDPMAEKMRRYSTYNYAFDNPVKFVDPDGKMPSIFSNIWESIKSTTKNVGKIWREYEPADINVNNIGFELGIGAKQFKFGNLARFSLEGSFFGASWDNKKDDINFKGPKGSLGIYLGGKKVGFELEAESIDIGLLSKNFKFLHGKATGNFFDVGFGENKLQFTHLAEGSVFDYSENSPWFNGKFGKESQPNRLFDLNNDGNLAPMDIIGGEVKYGIKADVEWNVTQTISRLYGGTGFGNNWKNTN
ncbi:DUF6443 domain-containing protein [Cloacibacterium sp.]|uniref:DUF6443 domain-containing protein n=1 Tax=Cloacibacterium sp. TaxID=1913682 RepID=UPI0035B3F753